MMCSMALIMNQVQVAQAQHQAQQPQAQHALQVEPPSDPMVLITILTIAGLFVLSCLSDENLMPVLFDL